MAAEGVEAGVPVPAEVAPGQPQLEMEERRPVRYDERLVRALVWWLGLVSAWELAEEVRLAAA